MTLYLVATASLLLVAGHDRLRNAPNLKLTRFRGHPFV
jgi:hypothetical protein